MEDESEDYPFFEEPEKIDETFNPKCRCPEFWNYVQ